MRIIALLAALAIALLAAGCTTTAEPAPTATPTPIVTGTQATFYSVGSPAINITGHALIRDGANVSVTGLATNPARWKAGGYFTIKWYDRSGTVLGATDAKVPILSPGETYRFAVAYDGGTSAAEVDHYVLAPGVMEGYR